MTLIGDIESNSAENVLVKKYGRANARKEE